MIVNIRGTSGSGKSTIVRKVIERYAHKEPVHVEWRRQPLGYFCYRNEGKTLWVPGHYETACGGCDTLPTIEFTYNLIRHYVPECDIVYEGLILQSDVVRCINIHKDGFPLLVVGLNTPLQECIRSVEERRAARGKTEPLNPRNTESKHRAVLLQERRFKEAGVDFRWLNREEALKTILEVFGWN